MPKRAKSLYIGLGVAALVAAISQSEASDESPNDLLIIVNSTVTQNTLFVDQVRDFFLKKRQNWTDGQKAVPIHAEEGTALRVVFRKRVLRLNTAEEQAYWQERIIKSGVEPPPSFNNTQKAVFKLHGAVGYIFRRDYHEGVVKVLLVIPESSK